MKQRILLTGSNGLLGHKLVPLLLRDPEIQLLATSRGPSRVNSFYPQLDYCPLELTKEADVRGVVNEFRPTLLLHAGAMTNVDQCESAPDECWKVNVDATEWLLDACARYATKVVYFSTDFVFDGESGPYDENDIPNPINHYGRSKLEAERLVEQSSLPWAIARTVLVYGTMPGGGRSNIILMVKEALEKGRPLSLVNDQYRTPTLADDLATGTMLLVEREATGIFHLSGRDLLTPFDMGVRVARRLGLDESLLSPTTTANFSQPGKRPLRTGFRIDKAKRELGYAPSSFDEGIGKVVAAASTAGAAGAGVCS